jgi:hypothetical protein
VLIPLVAGPEGAKNRAGEAVLRQIQIRYRQFYLRKHPSVNTIRMYKCRFPGGPDGEERRDGNCEKCKR